VETVGWGRVGLPMGRVGFLCRWPAAEIFVILSQPRVVIESQAKANSKIQLREKHYIGKAHMISCEEFLALKSIIPVFAFRKQFGPQFVVFGFPFLILVFVSLVDQKP